MRKTISILALGGVVAAALVLVIGRSSDVATAGPAVDVSGEWGYVYTVDGGPLQIGGCTGELLQVGVTFTSAIGGETECESGGVPTGTGCFISGTVAGLDLVWDFVCSGPYVDPFTGHVTATVSADGGTQEGDWWLKGEDPPVFFGTYRGSKLTATCVSPPCSDETLVFLDNTAVVTFAEVTATGGTTVLSTETTTTGGTLPPSFQLAGTAWATDPFYTVLTTTAFTGNIEFCLSYQDTDNDGFVDGKAPPVPESALRLLHNATGSFDPATVNTVDTTNNVVCAVVSGLSEFALGAEQSPTPTPTATPTPTPTATLALPTNTPGPVGGIALDRNLRALPLETSDPSGAGVGLLLGVVTGGSALTLIAGAVWYSRRRWQR